MSEERIYVAGRTSNHSARVASSISECAACRAAVYIEARACQAVAEHGMTILCMECALKKAQVDGPPDQMGVVTGGKLSEQIPVDGELFLELMLRKKAQDDAAARRDDYRSN